MYSKATETAIAAMSRLAEVFGDENARLSASQIAEARNLQRPFVAKVLTALAGAGLVDGVRGPGGGFRLARHPREITLHDVFVLFERPDPTDLCPFGGGVCGVGEKCALHDKLTAVQCAIDAILYETTFDVFRIAYQEEGLRPVIEVPVTERRPSFRAPSGRPG